MRQTQKADVILPSFSHFQLIRFQVTHTLLSSPWSYLASASEWEIGFCFGFWIFWLFSLPSFCLASPAPILSLSLNMQVLPYYNQKDLSGTDVPLLRILPKLPITFRIKTSFLALSEDAQSLWLGLPASTPHISTLSWLPSLHPIYHSHADSSVAV